MAGVGTMSTMLAAMPAVRSARHTARMCWARPVEPNGWPMSVIGGRDGRFASFTPVTVAYGAAEWNRPACAQPNSFLIVPTMVDGS